MTRSTVFPQVDKMHCHPQRRHHLYNITWLTGIRMSGRATGDMLSLSGSLGRCATTYSKGTTVLLRADIRQKCKEVQICC